MSDERETPEPDPDQQDPESGPAAEEEEIPTEDDSLGDPELEYQVASLEHEGDKLDEEIEDVKRDWKAKQGDASVPGAVPDPETEGEDEEADEDRPA